MHITNCKIFLHFFPFLFNNSTDTVGQTFIHISINLSMYLYGCLVILITACHFKY